VRWRRGQQNPQRPLQAVKTEGAQGRDRMPQQIEADRLQLTELAWHPLRQREIVLDEMRPRILQSTLVSTGRMPAAQDATVEISLPALQAPEYRRLMAEELPIAPPQGIL